MKKWPIALQVFSVRDAAEQDVYETFKRIKEMGYDGVELAGTYGKTVGEIKAILDEVGLELVSAHVGMEDLEDDATLGEFAATGMKYIAIPWMMAPQSEEELQQAIARIRNIGQLCKAKGMQLSYHNHDFEFQKIGGRYILDAIYEEISEELLQTQLDMCWVNVGGENPLTYLRKYAGRAPIVHLKDFAGKKGDTDPVNAFELRPVGYGLQDVPSILVAAEAVGAQWLVVEQDNPSLNRDSMECAQMSIRYLKTLI